MLREHTMANFYIAAQVWITDK